jgi:hypothetical protein
MFIIITLISGLVAIISAMVHEFFDLKDPGWSYRYVLIKEWLFRIMMGSMLISIFSLAIELIIAFNKGV